MSVGVITALKNQAMKMKSRHVFINSRFFAGNLLQVARANVLLIFLCHPKNRPKPAFPTNPIHIRFSRRKT